MKTIASILLCSILFSPPLKAERLDYRADCVLEVDGKIYIKGNCIVTEESDFDSTDARVFQLGVDKAGNAGRYWAYVLINKKGPTDGSWNAGDGSHAQARLGDLVQIGQTCWANKRTKICATRDR